ncbi:MAG: TetM/TetW/TetO/TetS family tetracycline resistance ribosomal protection protein [Ruminococcus sp.]|nr:TetM/TetW/TetO/TetS family tetracycline resistance ribosomal protection protein [Ruminococcus sp.]
MKRLVAGILAHVDSGKTTLSEGMLYRSGEIRRLGRVDHGDTFLDTHALERQRGITIFSKQAMLRLPELEITLLDTPGHVDFSAEMERTLQVLDYAILVISGTDGVQSHTETLWKLLERYHIPTFLFINKMDLSGTDRDALLLELKERLSRDCVDFSDDTNDLFYEQAALCEEALLEEFLETGEIAEDGIRRAVADRKIFPCYFGSARKLEGVDEFLSGIGHYTENPQYPEEFGARIFKIATDEQGSRLTYLKITGGKLRVRSQLNYQNPDGETVTEKVSQIRIYSGHKFQAIDTAEAGCVCAVTGLSQTQCGLGIGMAGGAVQPVLEPVMTYRLIPPPDVDAATALEKLRFLEEEDPQLHVIWNSRLSEIHIQLMGAVQLEILSRLIAERFQMEVQFDKGSIAYKETIAAPVEGVGHYEPLRHYAEVHILMEPLPRGSGLQFCTDCREEILDKNWQRLVLTHLQEKVHPGVLCGAPITDMRLTVVSGKAHLKHTEGGDFRQATYRAVRQGLRMAESILLEPWYAFRLEVPSEQVGRAMSDLQRMDAQFSPPELQGTMSVLTGQAAVSEMQEYAAEVTAYTQGRGRLSCMPDGYDRCHHTETVLAEIGYNCDRDTENPADSVFCAHGAGYLVRWDEVPLHMHLPYQKDIKTEPEAVSAPVSRGYSGYGGSLAEDKELMAIFERTYGKIRRDERSALHTQKERTPASVPVSPQKLGKEYLLVDGYNIIFAWDELKKLSEENLESARHRLIEMMQNYQGVRRCELIIVFDAYRVKGNPGSSEQIGKIHVVYTKEAETADTYIERATHELGKDYRVRVATSDRLEQIIILGNGAYRMSASEFYEEIRQTNREIQEYIETEALRGAHIGAGGMKHAGLSEAEKNV